MISASQLYNYTHCPHRVALDLYGDTSERDEPNAFVQLLWEQGVTHEAQIVETLGITANMKDVPLAEREQTTLDAMRRGERLIYGGRITSGDLVGEPDLLELRGSRYIPGDIKSGSGLEGEDSGDGKLKKHYAVQVAHYVQILEEIGFNNGSREAFIVDRARERVPYILLEPQGIRNTMTWWGAYQQALVEVRALVADASASRGALCTTCKLCHWYTHCKRELIAANDLTLIAELGRAKRDVLVTQIPTVADLAGINPDAYVQGKKTIFPGIGPSSLVKFRDRAKLLVDPDATPYLTQPVTLPIAEKEVYFDIEADPMRDIIYLHGFVERLHGQPETAQFIPFFSVGNTSEQEEEVFAQAWKYLSARVQDSAVYYYSKYERTAYRKLAEKYGAVCSVADVDGLFTQPAMIDLLDVVKLATEWPTYDRSIKTLAQYLGFQWRDTHPSGAASIEWYHRWIESQDPTIRQRILDYNEDDCLATGVLVDGIRAL